MNDDDVYYKIYLTRENLLTVVEMQWFDENDYNKDRFYSENGEIPQWNNKEEASKYLNDTFKRELIDPDCWGGKSDNFWNGFKK